MKENLQFLQSLVEDLNQTNSNNDKLATLKKAYAENPGMFATWMSYIYDYDKKYFMTSTNIQKCSELNNANHYDNIWDLLDDLNDRKITGHEAIGTVRHFIEENSEYEDLIYKIIDKDLKIRVSGTTINKVHTGLVKEFSVALAEKLQDCVGKHTINLDTEDWFIQYKIDGCRCITVIDECGNIAFYSRQGREILTLDNLKPEIQSLGLKNTCIDGEICIIDPTTGVEDFKSIMKEITRKNHTIENPAYIVYDILDKKDFDAKSSTEIYEKRFEKLENIFANNSLSKLRLIQCRKHGNTNDYEEMLTEVRKLNREGLMLRKNVGYEGDRSWNLIKCKEFKDAEYIVKDIELTTKGILINDKMVETECVGRLVIEHKGNLVGVGSGLSDQQRIEWAQDKSKIVGKTITVKYFEETTDEKGNPSLRFPILVYVYENGRDI